MASLFENKKGLITGVFNKQSIAWAIADQILTGGGTCGFSYMPDKPDDERKKNLGRVTKLIEGNETSSVTFTAPGPGTYTFLCTFPEHYAGGMKGTLTIQ